MKRIYRNHNQSGMTLVEIMIALLIGAFLMAGVLQIFISTKQTYRMQEGLSRLQENGRFALEFISRDIRTAGYWGCADSSDIENKLNADASFDPFATGLAAQNDDNGGNDGDADNDENGNTIWDGTDSITLRGASGSDISLTAQAGTLVAPLSVTNNSGLANNDFVVISDCVAGDIFQITGVVAGDTISHAAGNAGELGNVSLQLGSGQGATPDANIFDTDSQVYKLNFVTYQIRNGAGNQPALFRSINGGNFQELVEGIEDMQILYGEDTDADDAPNYYVPANNVVDMDNVVSIRVSLLVTSTDDNLTSQPVPYTYNGANTTPTDRRIRKVFTSTIAVRNRLS